MKNSTIYSNPMADASDWEGILALFITVIGLGSYHVPIRAFSVGDGFFVQWCMSIGALCAGFVIHAALGFPGFEPIAVLGGVFWTIANVISQRVISGLGLAVGLLLWNATNCLTGWCIGRFGLFGLKSKPPHSDVLNICGICFMLFGSFIISFVKKVPRTNQKEAIAKKLSITINAIVLPGIKKIPRRSTSMPDFTVIEMEARKEQACLTRRGERIFCIGLALFSGFFYGLTPVPILYIEENHFKFPNSPRIGLSFIFSMYFGIFITSTAIFLGYTIWKQNKPYINPNIAFPSISGGIIWGIAVGALILSIDIFGQTITYPITTTMPGVVASVWSFMYFKEINSRLNYILFGNAFLIIIVGAVAVFLSKIEL